MQIRFTEAAVRGIERQLAGQPFALQLVYDTEGCGCAVNGIAELWVVGTDKPPGEELKRAETGSYPVVYKSRQEVFFEERLTIDYNDAKRLFVLKSDGQIYNSHITLLDKR